jgi:pimeloyl-ACP methyl ester carboxylesterase
MERIAMPNGVTISYTTYGNGPPLVLVHGSFSDHDTNWQEARDLLADRFTVYAIARRGRGETSATTTHTIEDEAEDVVAVLREVGEPAFLLGHSHGASCALEAAARYPEGVRKLVLYEAPPPDLYAPDVLASLFTFIDRHDWDGLVDAFMRDVLLVPPAEIAEIRASPFWSVWTDDAQATVNDLRALAAWSFDASRFRSLALPVLFIIGSESPREIYLTDTLAAILPDARIQTLEGQAHEGMTTAPELFVDALDQFLLEAVVSA